MVDVMGNSYWYQPIIGLEIHLQLTTSSKMFCGCDANIWEAEPNTHVCPVCLGLPGALPAPNQKAIQLTQLMGLALDCKLAKRSKFDRKHYFYPDLPKGYQISQYDQPFATGGLLKFKIQSPKSKTNLRHKVRNLKQVRIRRVHLEEDTAKSIHQEGSTLIDFNKSGMPLMEIVTEPDIRSAQEALAVGRKIQQLAGWIGASEADMSKGQMRLELNISLQQIQKFPKQQGQLPVTSDELRVTSHELPNYKVEVKNINSFRYLKKIVEFEIGRQTKLLEQGQTPNQETRGWNEKGETTTQRCKETEADYRYFPEPDIPPLEFSKKDFTWLKANLPELPDALIKRYIAVDGLRQDQAKLIASNPAQAQYYQQLYSCLGNAALAANTIINQPDLVSQYANPADLANYIKKQKTTLVSDLGQLTALIEDVIKQNPAIVADYRAGKKRAVQALIGKLMAKTRGRAQPQLSHKLLLEKLESSDKLKE